MIMITIMIVMMTIIIIMIMMIKKHIEYLNVPDTAMTLVLDTTDSSNTRKGTITESCMEGDLFVFFILHGR